jgi:hypothetical protein
MIDDPSQASLPLLFGEDEPTLPPVDLAPLTKPEAPVHDDGDARGKAPRHRPVQAPPRYFSGAEVAEMFGRKPRTIRHWIATGRLKAFKVGNAVFVTEAQIRALMPDEEDWPDG